MDKEPPLDKASRDALAKRLLLLVYDVERSYDQGNSRPGVIRLSNKDVDDIIAAAALIAAQKTVT